MGKVAFACWFEDKGFDEHARVRYFRERNIEVEHVWGDKSEEEWQNILSKYDHIFCYNGSHSHSTPYARAIKKLNIPVTYHEGGILPARAHQFMDRMGVLGASSFCKDISWVTDEHMKKLAEWKEWYIKKLGLKEAQWKPGDYIFCPMQCNWDANFNPANSWSPYVGRRAMEEFVEDVQKKYEYQRIIFRCHPADIDNIHKYEPLIKPGNELQTSEWHNDMSRHEPELIRLMLNARQVIGVNSTCLLQSVLFGVPTKALGWGYIKSVGSEDPDEQLRMVAAVRHRTHRWNNLEQCERIMDEIHEPGKVFWR